MNGTSVRCPPDAPNPNVEYFCRESQSLNSEFCE